MDRAQPVSEKKRSVVELSMAQLSSSHKKTASPPNGIYSDSGGLLLFMDRAQPVSEKKRSVIELSMAKLSSSHQLLTIYPFGNEAKK